ncbi:MAG: hypothetical protein WCF75_18325, partial [Pseudolabrys sp.]
PRGDDASKFVTWRGSNAFQIQTSRRNDERLLSGVIRQWRQLGFRLFVMANTSRWRNRPILNTTKHAFEGAIHDRL